MKIYGHFTELFVSYYYRSEQLKTDTEAFEAIKAKPVTYNGETDIHYLQQVIDHQNHYDREKEKLDNFADSLVSLNTTITRKLETFGIKPNTKLQLKMEYRTLNFWVDEDGYVNYEKVVNEREK